MAWNFGLLGAAGAGAAPAYEHLATTTLSGATSSVTFSNLSQYSDYKHLQLRYVNKAESDGGSQNSYTTLRFNGDSTSSYTQHFLRGASGGDAGYFDNQNNIRISRMPVTFGTQNNNMFAGTVANILDFQNTNKNTTVQAFCGSECYTSDQVELVSGLYEKTNAITSIELSIFSGANSFSSGSRFSIYGIRG